jgi:hypothetical protein
VTASFTQARLERLVDEALRSAGALGVLPTPLEALRDAARVRSLDPIELLPAGLAPPDRTLLGAFWYAERALFVDTGQSAPRRRFTEAHELVHALCPWHEAVLRHDTEDELFRPVREAIEAEANAGAALLIFQGGEFRRRAAAEPPSIPWALRLAAEHGASAHATLHHLVESHADPVALLVAGRFARRDGSLPVWRSVESASFRARFGRARAPGGLPPGSDLHALSEAARTAGTAGAALRLRDRAGRRRRCRAEGHYNRHAFLILLAARHHAAGSRS